MSGRLLVLLLAFSTSVSLAAAPPSLLPVPSPDTAQMEPAVREQIEAERSTLAAAITRSPAGSPELGAAYGRCGQVYALYDLLDPAFACFRNAEQLAPGDPRWTYYLGVVYQTRGDFEAARERFLRFLGKRPQDGAALLRLGEVELLAGRNDDAKKHFESALSAASGAAAAHQGLGRIALAQGDAAKAVEHFEAALREQPAATVLHHQLGMAYRKLGQTEKARLHLASYGEGKVRFPDPLMEGLAQLNAGARRHVVLGTTALREGRFAAAAEELHKALESNPDDAAVWGNLGTALQRQGDLAGAEQSYRRALEIQPEDARAHYNLGTLLSRRGDRKGGMEHLETAVRLAPDNKDARFNLAVALAETGEPARALTHLDELLRRDPSDSVARYRRGEALIALGRPAEAADELGKVVASAPQAAAPRVSQAAALLLAGRDSEARSHLEEGFSRLPGNEPIAQLLARVLAASPQDAVRDGRKALDLAQAMLAAGSTADREETMAMALAEVGRFGEAVEHQKKALAFGEKTGMRERLALYEKSRPLRKVF